MRTQLGVRSSWPSQGAGVEGADGTTSAAAEVFLQLHVSKFENLMRLRIKRLFLAGS